MRPALQRLGLRVASIGYGLAVRCRNWLYDRGHLEIKHAPVPVICVGNLTVGGTGKTPCVEYVARYFRERDIRVAILSRGYGAVEGRNDEALVLDENLPDVPHLQGKDRAALAETALEELESELLILDDGFQHRRLARRLDIVLVDATQPWGYGYLLPRGLLREPITGLKRAGMIIITRVDQVFDEVVKGIRARLEAAAPQVPYAESVHQPEAWVNSAGESAPVDEFAGKQAAAFCGIGNPEAFRQTLNLLGIEPTDLKVYPDHHAYQRDDVRKLEQWARRHDENATILTTQKDLVKLRVNQLGGKPLWALRIGLKLLNGKVEFDRCLNGVLE